MKDCGPAFPATRLDKDGELDYYMGMTLRDYFAAAALQSVIASNLSDGIDAQIDNAAVALHSYDIADAMLAERGKK